MENFLLKLLGLIKHCLKYTATATQSYCASVRTVQYTVHVCVVFLLVLPLLTKTNQNNDSYKVYVQVTTSYNNRHLYVQYSTVTLSAKYCTVQMFRSVCTVLYVHDALSVMYLEST